ncbi:hypothetical protein [Priestia megaterium]|uniref:hypothetical protein n=1 Tax=Priestia megaterium TaxID=1404 RepID=UPI001E0D8255|nr:hypothetical protein [Priestia megaterium]CAH0311601.1 hypothetical protein SRABI82_04962 [Priestia megaterium]
MARRGEKITKEFLESQYGFEVVKIPETDQKTPDFEVRKNGKLLFYCEEKTMNEDDFEGEKPDPAYNSISRKIHESVNQFKSVNGKRNYPNVLVLNNMDTLRNINDLAITVTGKALTAEGKWLQIRNVSNTTQNDKKVVDLILWFDKGKFINFFTLNPTCTKDLAESFGVKEIHQMEME